MRFRLVELLVAVLIVGFACAALAQPTPLFETLFYSFTLLFLLASILLAIVRTGEVRMFWVGFAVCSCLYLCFALIHVDSNLGPRLRGPEITTRLLWPTYRLFHGAEGYRMIVDSPNPSPFGGGQSWYDGSDAFARIWHSAWALMFGWIGGHVTCFLYRRSRRELVG